MNKIGEKELRYIVNEACEKLIREYLDSNLMAPLRNYLGAGGKKYDQNSFRKLYHDYQVGDTEITSQDAFDKYEVFRNGWVIHFTNNPYSIIMDGFKGVGKDMMPYLWRTFGRGLPMDENEGYTFAFDANDEIPDSSIDYGKYALMFRTSGLKVHNLGDLGEWQVIFNSKMANMKNCFILSFDTKSEPSFNDAGEASGVKHITGVFVINPNTKKAVYKAGNIEQAIRWVETNERQYSGANTFNNIGKLNNTISHNNEVLAKIVAYFKQNFNGRYAIEEPYNHGDYTSMCIVYENTPENVFRIRPFKEFINSMKTDDIRYQICDVSDASAIHVWKSKYGDSPINTESGPGSYRDLTAIYLRKKKA